MVYSVKGITGASTNWFVRRKRKREAQHLKRVRRGLLGFRVGGVFFSPVDTHGFSVVYMGCV